MKIIILTKSLLFITLILSTLFSLVGSSFSAEIDDIKSAIVSKRAKWIAAETSIHKMDTLKRKMRVGLTLPTTVLANGSQDQTNTIYLASAPSGGFDWRANGGSNYTTPIKDQGSCGSCWAFATTAALESYTLIHGTYDVNKNLSEQILISCGGAGSCSGGYIDMASTFIQHTGLPSENIYPYTVTNGSCSAAASNWTGNTDKINVWNWVCNGTPNVSSIKNSIYTYGPVVASMMVYSDFYSYGSGIYSHTTGTYQGAHAVLVVGYADDIDIPGGGYFIVKNSWGTGWGEGFGNQPGGYFRIAYSEIGNLVQFGKYTLAYDTTTTACNYAISPTTLTIANTSGNGSISVTTGGSCTWTLRSDSSWLTVTPTTATNGNGTIYFAASANSGASSRQGIVSLLDSNSKVVGTSTITQSASLPVVSVFTIPSAVNSLTVPIINFTVTSNSAITGYLVTSTSNAPLANATSWKPTKPTSFTATATGPTTLYAWARDTAGNVSLAKSATVIIDTTKPVISTFMVTTPVNSLTIPVTAFAATDNVGVVGYMITTSSIVPLATATGWSADAPTSFTVTSAGSKTLYAWVKDAAGNVSAATTTPSVVDVTKPVVATFTVPTTSNILAVGPITVSATDNVAVAVYQITESVTAPDVSDKNWSVTKPAGYTFAPGTADGIKTLYAWAKDTAGNISLAKSATVNVDTTLPVVSDFTVPSIINTLKVPILTFAVNDNTTITGYMITANSTVPLANGTGWSTTKPTSFTATATGPTTLYAWARDTAGNVSLAKSATVIIDTTKPVISTFMVTTPVNSLTIPVTAFAATDNVGVVGYMITTSSIVPLATATGWSADAPTSFTVTSAGSKTLYAWVKDAAGNVSAATTTPSVVDVTKPVVATFTVPTTSNILAVGPITVSATDNVAVAVYQITESVTAPDVSDKNWSVTKPAGYTFAPGTADGIKTLYAWAKDTAGNISLAKSATVNVDTTLPVVSDFTVPSIINTLKVPILTFAVNDNTTITGYMITANSTVPLANGTGWSTTKPTSFTATATGPTTLYAWARDTAGNVSLAKSATVIIDTTKPVISTFMVTTPVNSLTIPVTAFAATDNVGVVGYMITTSSIVPLATATGWSADAPTSFTVTSAGSKTLYAWVKDAAGNVSAVKSATVTIK